MNKQTTVTFTPNALGCAVIFGGTIALLALAFKASEKEAKEREEKAERIKRDYTDFEDRVWRSFGDEAFEATMKNEKIAPDDRARAYKVLRNRIPHRCSCPTENSKKGLKDSIDIFDRTLRLFKECDEHTIKGYLDQYDRDIEMTRAKRAEQDKIDAEYKNAKAIADAIKYNADTARKQQQDERKFELDKYGMLANTVVSLATAGKEQKNEL